MKHFTHSIILLALLSPVAKATPLPRQNQGSIIKTLSTQFKINDLPKYFKLYLWARNSSSLLQYKEFRDLVSQSRKINPQPFFQANDKELLHIAFGALIARQPAQVINMYHKYRLKNPENQLYFEAIRVLAGEPIQATPYLRRINLNWAKELSQKSPESPFFHSIYTEALLESSSNNTYLPKQLQAGLKLTGKHLERTPQNQFLRFQYAELLYLSMQKKAAKTQFKLLLKEEESQTQESIADFYRWMKEPDLAEPIYLKLITKTPKPRYYNKLSLIYQTTPDKLAKLYLNALRNSENQDKIYQYIHHEYLPSAPDNLIEKTHQWIKKYPQNPYYTLLIADFYFLKNNHTEADRYYQIAIKQQPLFKVAYQHHLQSLWEQKKYPALKKQLAQLSQSPIKSLTYYWKGILALETNQPQTAILALKTAYQHEASPQVAKALGAAYQLNGDLKKAKAIFKPLFQRNPNNKEITLRMAELYRAEKQYLKAEKYYLYANAKHPYKSQIYYELGNLYSEIKQVKLAKEAYQKSILIQPTHLNARNNLGNLYLGQKYYLGALKQYKVILEIDKDNATGHYNMACVYASIKYYDQAFQYLKRAFSLDPQFKKLAIKDSDLDNIRSKPQFKALVK